MGDAAGAAEPNEGVEALAVAKSHCGPAPCEADICNCCVCGAQFNEANRSGTHFKDHCNQCSLDLRNIRKACGDDLVEDDDEDTTSGKKVTIKAWMNHLQKNNLQEYREVFGVSKNKHLECLVGAKRRLKLRAAAFFSSKKLMNTDNAQGKVPTLNR